MELQGYDPSYVSAILPPPSHTKTPAHPAKYISVDVRPKPSRKIFHSVTYSPYEMETIDKLHKKYEEQGINLPDDWLLSDSLKMVYTGKFDVDASVTNTKTHLEWRANEQGLIMPEHIPIMFNSSFIFPLGKDKQFRPVIYIRLQVMKNKKKFGVPDDINFENEDQSIDWAIRFIKRFCLKKYFIENWVMIVDCNDMGIMSFPVKFFLKLLGIMQLNHAACLHRLFLVNTPFSFNSVWVNSAMIAQDTLEKIHLLGKKDYKKMLEDIEPDQLLEEYGGSLKMPEKLWPPASTYTKEKFESVQPVNVPETAEDPFVYEPGVNEKTLKGEENELAPFFQSASPENFKRSMDERGFTLNSMPGVQYLSPASKMKYGTTDPDLLKLKEVELGVSTGDNTGKATGGGSSEQTFTATGDKDQQDSDSIAKGKVGSDKSIDDRNATQQDTSVPTAKGQRVHSDPNSKKCCCTLI